MIESIRRKVNRPKVRFNFIFLIEKWQRSMEEESKETVMQ